MWLGLMMQLAIPRSLGVEPVDKDVMTRPPRKSKDRMITLSLLLQICCTAAIIVVGTLGVFWKEVCGVRGCV